MNCARQRSTAHRCQAALQFVKLVYQAAKQRKQLVLSRKDDARLPTEKRTTPMHSTHLSSRMMLGFGVVVAGVASETPVFDIMERQHTVRSPVERSAAELVRRCAIALFSVFTFHWTCARATSIEHALCWIGITYMY